jgi:hypothetical protein
MKRIKSRFIILFHKSQPLIEQLAWLPTTKIEMIKYPEFEVGGLDMRAASGVRRPDDPFAETEFFMTSPMPFFLKSGSSWLLHWTLCFALFVA